MKIPSTGDPRATPVPRAALATEDGDRSRATARGQPRAQAGALPRAVDQDEERAVIVFFVLVCVVWFLSWTLVLVAVIHSLTMHYLAPSIKTRNAR